MVVRASNDHTNPVIDKSLKALDADLTALVADIDILNAIGPLNYREQRQLFFDQHFSVDPQFVYREHAIDPFLLKRDLFNLPIETIQHPDLYRLYADVIVSYVDKVDQYKSLGTPEFLYDSLRYYGEPTEKDVRNAQFILHLPQEDLSDEPVLGAAEIKTLLNDFGQAEGYEYELIEDASMIANALVSGTRVKINSAAEINLTDAKALAHHELGVHLVTTLNGQAQPLKILSLGCPLNTMTQEGLAIFAEYQAGFMTVKRLRTLALRVLAVDSMITEKSFRNTFLLLKEQYDVPDQLAFTITARVYRGGGFTKDYLYLQGFHKILNLHPQEPNFNRLLVGKTSMNYLPEISRLIDEGIFVEPVKMTPAFREPAVNDGIKQFIAQAIKGTSY
jgi:uncharacterized protein (TIGR02421 family)